MNGRHLESLRQLRHNRDEPEMIEHDLWEDENENMPKLNVFSVTSVNSMKVCNNLLSIYEFTFVVQLKVLKSLIKKFIM